MGSFVLFAVLFVGCGPGALSYELFRWNIVRQILATGLCMDCGKTNKGFNCNSSWHFNASLIEDLMPQMRKWWPDLLNPSPSPATIFWKHEWMKHGTCAAQAETMNTEHKYFSKALELYGKLNLDGTLRSHNILPSENYYTLDEIEGAIFGFYKVKPKIQCVHPATGEEIQVLGQIEICFDTEFTLVDCHRANEEVRSHPNDSLTFVDTGFKVCDPATKIYYPPPKTGSTKHHMGGFL